ncbi:expressed unknown protein [Ectocarpus siliculosus]|uniref:SAM domain-containing protein n=1 Tax=Ectocarpus siliculosus TaxID=2880 RepID=D8LAW3_ECTSI|nr:expressed unknown protein [Ectocarpus siliculosus]|eukprot:CBN76472.1 expressed unknown protein [Ectocarpus siliculosus]
MALLSSFPQPSALTPRARIDLAPTLGINRFAPVPDLDLALGVKYRWDRWRYRRPLGIDSPDMLSELDVVDFPELGISDQNDRKKLFYLIQRVKLALARGRAAEDKTAPQADSVVSLAPNAAAAHATAAASQRDAGAKESRAADKTPSSVSQTSVRFRRELEVPAARGAAAASPRAAVIKSTPSAVAHLTPAKAQRLPPSHRRPKTPHADGAVRGRNQQTSAAVRSPSPAANRGRLQRQQQQQQPVARLAVARPAAPETGVAVLAVERHDAALRHEQRGVGSSSDGEGARGRPTAHERRPSRPKKMSKPAAEHRRSALEPVQLDEAGGRASISSSDATAEHLLAPPPGHSLRRPAPGECTAEGASPRGVSRSQAGGGWTERSKSFGSHAVAQEESLARRRSLEGHPPPSNTGGAPPATAALVPTVEVARLYPGRRDAADAGSGTRRIRAETLEAWNEDDDPVGSFSASARRVEIDCGENQVSAAEGGRRESAAELAMHLISAHREDVRSALAAARKDMDLVSKADQDRRPAALMEYARDVEGVLGERLAAGARLRKALDSYIALRKSTMGGVATGATPAGVHELQAGRPRVGRRAVHA